MHRALYRKYRPKNFEDVVGQDSITQIIKNQINQGKTAHAYLFTGSRGTGKTTCAKIMAKGVNCLQGSEGDPCGMCDICEGIDNGSILDVLEIDAASNNSVEDVRELREEAVYTPAITKYRVYIIDEAHMLSVNAFNALLKIMEEPPAHVLFILATTEVHKIPATILSRCQRFDFRRIDTEIIADRLEYVSHQEGITINREGAMYIAKLSEGGMRDALSLLDVCAAKHDQVDGNTVSKTAGLLDQDYLVSLVDGIVNKDVAAVLEALDNAYERSVVANRLVVQLIDYYRDMMMIGCVKEADKFLTTVFGVDKLKEQSKALGMATILESITLLGETLDAMGRTAMGNIQLEMAMIRLCSDNVSKGTVSSGKVDLSGITARINSLENQILQLVESGVSPVAVDKAPIKEQLQPQVVPVTDKDRKAAKPFKQWQSVLEILKASNGPLYGTLVESTGYICDDILLIDCKSDVFLTLIRENDYAKTSLREAALSVTGTRYKLGPFKEESYRIAEEETDIIDDIVNTLEASQVAYELE